MLNGKQEGVAQSVQPLAPAPWLRLLYRYGVCGVVGRGAAGETGFLASPANFWPGGSLASRLIAYVWFSSLA